MILHRSDGRQTFVSVTGATMGQSIDAITLTASDMRDLMGLEPEQLKGWLATSVMTRFAPYDYWEDRNGQRRQVEDHNLRLKGSEAIDDFQPAQFSARSE